MSLIAEFTAVHGRPPSAVWRAPGRVNLIGEHTDYNDGLVLPFAIGLGVTVAAGRRDDGMLELRSRQAGGATVAVPVAGLEPGRPGGWAAYPAGVAWMLRDHGVRGASLLVDADLPQGAGLSSSAALGCAAALALCDLYGVGLGRPELALLVQQAENRFAGMPCGILDQTASLRCEEGHALLLDCRSGAAEPVPLPLAGLSALVVDTRAAHALTDGGYAARRAQCERAAGLLGVPALRDVTDLPAALAALPDAALRRRVAHVVTENARVEAAAGLLRGAAGDPGARLGALLTASHASLRDRYEVSWPEADVTVAAALEAGALGGRMVGGGFGGSVLLLARTDRADQVLAAVRAAYAGRGWEPPRAHRVAPAAGARRLS
ncbi:galactokinase [Actinomadura macrotermitis]|uniref:Galactokinase n=1 Tax=Actinomadura macrotermitis TaxID=2585200 RepID=A0A7K0C2L9_9ACTN|nr:Galactokinase [Actinomadura macrotermitis]